MTKSHWVTDGDNMRLSMPFQKVDRENRLVSGYATLDNIDSQGDVVLAEASAKAFARARGNIREMHQPIAVGHLVDFREDEYLHYDPETGESKFYRGIYVTAYVSKGAESTWEKVLDGTLTGFSIGGNIKDASTEFVKEADANIRFIKDYDLVELSLVDNPANQLANVFSIQKASDGSVTMKGMIVDTEIENIFWCETDGVARTIESDTASCVNCGNQMENIGWVENGEQKEDKVREIVAKFLSRNKDSDAVNDAIGEGGVNVSKFSKSNGSEEVVAGVDEGRESEAVENDVPAAEKNVDGAEGAEQVDDGNVRHTEQQSEPADVAEGEVVAGVDEVPDESEEVAKRLDALTEAITKSLEETREATESAVTTLEKKVDALASTFEEKTSEFAEKFRELGTNLETAKSSVAELEKSLEVINDADAMKKSADVEKSAEPKQKENLWGGAFSVNNLVR